LLKYHSRVLYIDIDIHHGDGVEEAFYNTNRVMTVSFHKFGEFFPGTGDPRDVGADAGKYYAVNFPLKDGINDWSYENIFKPLMSRIMESYRPEAVVLQCGADSLAGDRLGCFNLTLKGHAMCVNFMKSYNLPLLVLGGGGYTIRNVARCWTYETAQLLNTELADQLPYNDYLEYYGPDYRLHIEPSNMDNQNSTAYLDKHLQTLIENMRHVEHAPSVAPFNRPPDHYTGDPNFISRQIDAENDKDPETRMSRTEEDRRVAHEKELYDPDDKRTDPQRDHHDYHHDQPQLQKIVDVGGFDTVQELFKKELSKASSSSTSTPAPSTGPTPGDSDAMDTSPDILSSTTKPSEAPTTETQPPSS